MGQAQESALSPLFRPAPLWAGAAGTAMCDGCLGVARGDDGVTQGDRGLPNAKEESERTGVRRRPGFTFGSPPNPILSALCCAKPKPKLNQTKEDTAKVGLHVYEVRGAFKMCKIQR